MRIAVTICFLALLVSTGSAWQRLPANFFNDFLPNFFFEGFDDSEAEEEIPDEGNGISNSPTATTTTCPCGLTAKKRIVGGTTTSPNEYPFMVSLVLRDSGDHFCGASILTESHLITAAHCTHGLNRPILALAGAHDLRKAPQDKNVQRVAVRQTIEHERYSDSDQGVVNDIAILILASKLKFNTRVSPLCVPVGRQNLQNQAAKIIGWGKLGQDLPPSPTLQEINVRVYEPRECRRIFPAYSAETMICSGNPKATACMGDSGGPVIWLDPATGRYTLSGLVSYGRPGCNPDLPTVQTDVSAFLPWISSKVQGQLCHKS